MRADDPFPWRRIAQTLEATPAILRYLLQGVLDDEADFRPDPDRLTIREVVVHLGNWEKIVTVDFRRMLAEDCPALGENDGGSHIAPPEEPGLPEAVDRFATARGETVALLQGLEPPDWGRTAMRRVYGPTTVDAQATMLMMHDVYHIQQVAQWRQLFQVGTGEA
jgi:hypothetical protein